MGRFISGPSQNRHLQVCLPPHAGARPKTHFSVCPLNETRFLLLLERWRNAILICCVLKFIIGFERALFHLCLLGLKLLAWINVIYFCHVYLEFKMRAPFVSLPRTYFQYLPRCSNSLPMLLGLPNFWRKHRP